MIFDTDILLWYERGHPKAAHLIDTVEARHISIQTYMEFLQGARSQTEILKIKDFLLTFGFQVIPLTENIGHRASIYIEEYTVALGLRAGDAIIAATAVENNLELATGNQKHFRDIRDLKLKLFAP